MTITEYLAASGRSLSDLAAASGLHHSYLSRLANGRRSNPTLTTARRLVEASGGLITYESLGVPSVVVPERHVNSAG